MGDQEQRLYKETCAHISQQYYSITTTCSRLTMKEKCSLSESFLRSCPFMIESKSFNGKRICVQLKMI